MGLKMGDIVQTNLAFYNGFDDYPAPNNMKRKINLKVIGMVIALGKNQDNKKALIKEILSRSEK